MPADLGFVSKSIGKRSSWRATKVLLLVEGQAGSRAEREAGRQAAALKERQTGCQAGRQPGWAEREAGRQPG